MALREQNVTFASLRPDVRENLRQSSLETWREQQPEAFAGFLSDALALVDTLRESGSPPTPPPRPRRGDVPELEILFASDRNDERARFPDAVIHPSSRMGSKRDHNERYCGIAPVEIDPKRPFADESAKYFKLKEFDLIKWNDNGELCIELIQSRINASPSLSLLIFVHGYNNTFYDAVKRAASLAKDIEFPGVTMIWSWPAAGGTLDYWYDEDSALWTRPHFRELLNVLGTLNGLNRLHLLSHSMGARIVIDVLEPLADPEDEGRWPDFDHLVFAAPDVAIDVFREQGPRSRRFADWTTLYASSGDQALLISARVHSAREHKVPRAGLGGFSDIVVQEGLDSIDATGIDSRLFSTRHAYVFDRPKGVSDLRSLILDNASPKQRGLKSKAKNQLEYWLLTP